MSALSPARLPRTNRRPASFTAAASFVCRDRAADVWDGDPCRGRDPRRDVAAPRRLARDPLLAAAKSLRCWETYAALVGILFAARRAMARSGAWNRWPFAAHIAGSFHRRLAIGAHAVLSTLAYAGGSIAGFVSELISLVPDRAGHARCSGRNGALRRRRADLDEGCPAASVVRGVARDTSVCLPGRRLRLSSTS